MIDPSSSSSVQRPVQICQFTGKERDSETGLDYFGAMYYSGAQGRFLTADWSSIPEPVPYANFDNLQTLNLYAYVNNNPLSFADADGHKLDCSGRNAEGAGCKAIADSDR
jgi:RHS repeat-associated protein